LAVAPDETFASVELPFVDADVPPVLEPLVATTLSSPVLELAPLKDAWAETVMTSAKTIPAASAPRKRAILYLLPLR
jgi:hypothetical protein